MAVDPVAQWEIFSDACNTRDWSAVEAMLAEDYAFQVVLGGVLATPSARRLKRAALVALLRGVADERGWTYTNRSMIALGDTVVACVDSRFSDGSTRSVLEIVKFNDDGKLVEHVEIQPAG